MDDSASDPARDHPDGETSLALHHLLAQTGGDDALARELLGLLAAQCEALLPVAAGEGDPAARADAAHTLKGSAAALGAFRLARACGAAETELRDRRPDPLDSVAAMERAVAALRPRLASLLAA